MASFWKRLWDELILSPPASIKTSAPAPKTTEELPRGAALPKPPPVAEQLASRDYPTTYFASNRGSENDTRAQVFDPALKQFPRAFRAGVPKFYNSGNALAWRVAHLRMLYEVAKRVSRSPWAEHLVLRGSLLMQEWFADAARMPGDIDWVYQPASIRLQDSEAQELFASLKQLVIEQPEAGPIAFDVERIAMDDIWTYDRAPGRRIAFPWHAPGLPSGCVQMDVVFAERLEEPPQQTTLHAPDGNEFMLWTASRPLSLAWKLMWLETDAYPQGKDLYDATLLAEHTPLRIELFEKVWQSGTGRRSTPVPADFPLRWNVDWENFQAEFPDVPGTAQDWQTRLNKALQLQSLHRP